MGLLTDRFTQALAYAVEAHAEQRRKGTEIPYAAHLLAVTALALEAGGDEDAAIVAILHDVVEDQGGGQRLADIRARFGDGIADAVAACSAEESSDGLDWVDRKELYVERMRTAPVLALRASLADKVHNLESIVEDYRQLGGRLFDRFGAPDAESVVRYYESLAEVYQARTSELHRPLLARLGRALAELQMLLRRPDCLMCGAGYVVPVIVGLPTQDDVDLELAGYAVLAGCVVGTETPDWVCRICGHGWPDEGRRAAWR